MQHLHLPEEKLTNVSLKEASNISIDPRTVENEVLKRLIQEVEVEKMENKLNSYNRTHNRHNRGR